MKVSLMQPNIFMWCGLLKSIIDSDLHIIRDDVKITKNSRYNRNNICGDSPNKIWLTIPFVSFHDHKLIKEQYLSTSVRDQRKVLSTFKSRYSKFKYYKTSLNIISETLDFEKEKTCLTEVYLAFLNSLRSIGLPICKTVLASEFLKNRKDYQKLKGLDMVNYLLKEAQATSYLAAENTINYANPKSYEVSRVCLQKYIQVPYSQRKLDEKDSFIPNLSCLDLLASENISNVMKILEESNSWTYFNN